MGLGIQAGKKECAMKAMVYQGPGKRDWQEVADPTLRDDTDAIVRVDAVTICGTDLHILKGDVPEVREGTVLGHEAVGTVEQVGSGVKSVRPGDRVLVSCISSCGRCEFCRRARYGQCTGGGGWILGHTTDGVQAEQARVPFADTSTYQVPAGVSDEEVLMLADIGPTAYEVGVLNAGVTPGESVVVVGAGPIGLAAVMAARLFSPAHVIVVDPATSRREAALRFGADAALDPAEADVARLRELTDGRGLDVAIEAVGIPETFEQCAALLRPGGRLANVGVHGAPAQLHLERLWIRDITVTTGLVDTYSMPTLLRLLARRQIDLRPFVTHRFGLDDFEQAYATFGDAARTEALKVVLSRS
ncbi:MAG TPA: zinc-dependent alcohol dehydrogenase family protein [Segeticoccus sp.]|uniref:zinc-dependent alcohol dehydrogenase family protein n=1 Tax=Segeticoccus sp. TaxID=2706531 RepID=UPI002D7E87CD|nr:zinc-dependent alcohol dehydrogenase family protein [Segeticoccus sp.]HET8600976.1 zinc-dependent alcohol dehydrogenase family protein [Segeticoccus sp.]